MTKIISLSDVAYDKLKEIKIETESFSKVILRIVEKEKRRPLTDFWGKWPGNKEELKRISKHLYRERKAFKTREIKF